ncbi:MAG TPA: AbrB/MazE/SpoVT family DNA-binding domain-containing protein [Candidatus Anaerofilum excrementigallinarum]|nr:AbrB/MazE/SpoVT family DNA-binding domain-containing protein [Candidatus Anaerofilum excrementigallinarum]
MKSTGIVRKIDHLGRIVLPIELRRVLDIDKDSSLEIYVENDSILLRKYQPACVFCGSSEEVASYKGRNICAACRKEIGQL